MSSKMYNVACLLKIVRWVECGRCCWMDSAFWLAVLNAMLAKGFSSPLGVTLQHVSHKNMHGDSFLPHVNQHPGQKFRFSTTSRYHCLLFAHPWCRHKCGRRILHRTPPDADLESEFLQSPHPGLNPIYNQLFSHSHDSTAYKLCMKFKGVAGILSHALLHFVTGRAEVFTVHNRSGRPIRER